MEVIMLNERAEKVLQARYAERDEKGNPVEKSEDIFRRVAKAVAEPYKDIMGFEDFEQEFADSMLNLEFMPNSPTLMNAGKNDLSLSACFVIDIQDSINSIYDAIKNSALIQQSGGGVGMNLSLIREEDAIVTTTGGKASGPISFLKTLDASTEAVKQGGTRRGACMAILRVDHPDIEKFITCKQVDGNISNFNLSVAITDEFMHCVENDLTFDLISPHTHLVTKTLQARDLWDLIITNAHGSGDPGIFFIDTTNRNTSMPKIILSATNPCVTGDTKILTDEGYVRIDSVVGKKTNVWNGKEFSTVMPKVTGKDQNIRIFKLSNGVELRTTLYHGFILKDGSKVEARDLRVGDKLVKFNLPVIEGQHELHYAYTQGAFSGDGFISEKSPTIPKISLYGVKKYLADHLDTLMQYSDTNPDRDTYKLPVLYDKLFVPNVEYSIKSRLEWLAGLLDTDGSRNSSEGSLAISSVELEFLRDVQLMLQTLGVHSSIGLMKEACTKLMPDQNGGQKEYECRDCYRLCISASNTGKLNELGLTCYRIDTSANPNRDASRFVTVEHIEMPDYKVEKVYCFTEPELHQGVFNGVLTANCGEQALDVYDSCNLGSINLNAVVTADSRYVNINYAKLKKLVKMAVRALDAIITINHFPIPEIAERTVKTRNIGLGIMGLADILIKMDIPYDSERARAVASDIMEHIQEYAEEESEHLARILESFPWHKDSKFTVPRRNANLTTIAPTGTISIIANCSSGLEPLFALGFTRNQLDTTFVEISDVARDYLIERNLWSNEVEKIIGETGSVQSTSLPDEIKAVLKTANEIAPEDHVKMQAVLQAHVDSSISKTVNLPNSASVKDVSDIYTQAYVSGCKGVTVYRDGCKQNQVLVSGTEVKEPSILEVSNVSIEKRPKSLYGMTEKVRTGCGSMLVTVNWHDGKVYEVIVNGGTNSGCTSQSEATARLASILFRAGLPIDVVSKQLKGLKCPSALKNPDSEGLSCPDVMMRVIKRVHDEINAGELVPVQITPSLVVEPEAETVNGMYKCPECGNFTLTLEEGCRKCVECGYSKC
jgi:ribonucleoside-diphosphate reductase alpha chain